MTLPSTLCELAGVTPATATVGTLPHYKRPERPRLLCGREVSRPMTGTEADAAERFCGNCTKSAEKLAASSTAAAKDSVTPERAYVERLASASPLAGAALAFGDLVEETDARSAAIKVHYFDTTEEAREAAERDELADADVVVVKREKVVGFLAVALIVALTEEKGAFPHLYRPSREYMEGGYTNTVVVAEREAHAHGFLLRDESPYDRLRAMIRQRREAEARIAQNPDPCDPEWLAAVDRVTVAYAYLSEHSPGFAERMNADAARIANDLEALDREHGSGHSRPRT